MANERAAETATWREMAVARSLDPARARAEERVQRFLDAAMALMQASPDREFTVQEVVERSGQSLRSFYQYFAGKHELLLAMFEESVRSAAEQVVARVEGTEDPLERLHLFTSEYYRICRPSGGGKGTANAASVMADFAQQLLTKHPDEAAKAFAPLVSAYEDMLDDAAAAGSIRPGLDHRRITGVVLQAVMFNTFADTISASSVRPAEPAAEGLWELLLDGLGVGPRT
ncbi:TetR/AcrR family transcriptional regulator [Dermatobacter hominis]|uniref:TetR/AcrR family transcriptional regulator n=1 Tax=Dermatobacter hominis TaxID=2884263 RepID=UPI001D0F5911|nr:TetR/AcrR family transcriptional regulator [Dermatobacter hominis]UDY36644.1 TetR/AcrR family transcriptional regulator [Dermatobacter hominis]